MTRETAAMDTPGHGPRPPRSDLPSGGLLTRLHLLAGRMAGYGVALTRPRMSVGVRLHARDVRGNVLLVRHSYVPGWHLPGGGIDRRETAREAAIREAAEEGGMRLAEPPALFHVYLRRTATADDHVILFAAEGVAAPDRPRGPSAEILASGFFRPDDLPAETTPATRRRIAEICEGLQPSDWW